MGSKASPLPRSTHVLYLVSTPIGNLSDISMRALESLRNSSLILCEDTRHSKKLLFHHGITEKTLLSYHKFNEAQRLPEILEALRQGDTVSLISDAGTPGIADPGERLIAACIEADLPFTSIPGPCALIQALVGSGLPTAPFQFLGFVPKKKSERQTFFQRSLQYPGTSLCYESPVRLCDSLRCLETLDNERQLVVARELTKKFENYHRGTASELLSLWKEHPPKGECVLLIDALRSKEETSTLSLDEEVELVQERDQLSRSDAIAFVARLRGLPKRVVYQAVHKAKQEEPPCS